MDLSSFSILLFLLVGLLLGYTVFPPKWLKINGYIQTLGIALTLFSMGVSLGGSPTFIEDIKSAGIMAVVFALATVLGSVFLVYLLTRVFFKQNK